MAREERLRSEDLDNIFRAAADNCNLNYNRYLVQGKAVTKVEESYTNHNTSLLEANGVVKKIMTTDYVQEELRGIRSKLTHSHRGELEKL